MHTLYVIHALFFIRNLFDTTDIYKYIHIIMQDEVIVGWQQEMQLLQRVASSWVQDARTVAHLKKGCTIRKRVNVGWLIANNIKKGWNTRSNLSLAKLQQFIFIWNLYIYKKLYRYLLMRFHLSNIRIFPSLHRSWLYLYCIGYRSSTLIEHFSFRIE